MPSVQTVSILHRRHFLIFAFYFSITTVLSVSLSLTKLMDIAEALEIPLKTLFDFKR